MPVVRQKLTAQQFFDAMHDERLGIKARGVLATLQTMEEGREFTLQELAESLPDSYPVILSNVRELENLGYLGRKSIYGENGRKCGSEYRLFNDRDRV